MTEINETLWWYNQLLVPFIDTIGTAGIIAVGVIIVDYIVMAVDARWRW